MAMDDAAHYCWTMLLKSKDELPMKMIELIKELKDMNQVQVKRSDVTMLERTQALRNLLKQKDWAFHFEYTARKTPQQNGRVERKFATLYGRVRSMLNGSKLPKDIRDKLWAECAATATHVENLIVTPNKPTPYPQFYGEGSKLQNEQKTFGEVGIVNDAQKIQSKLGDRGSICIFVGYATNCASKTYRMFNMKSKEVWISRDIKWMNQVYGNHKPTSDDTAPVKYAESDGKEDLSEVDIEEEPSTPPTPVNPKALSELRRLNTSYSPTAQNILNQANAQLVWEEGEAILVATASVDGDAIDHLFSKFQDFAFYSKGHFEATVPTEDTKNIPVIVDEPETFQEAFHHPDEVQREMWRAAIHKEFRDMLKRTVWQNKLRSQIPNNRRCIKSKWVFSLWHVDTARYQVWILQITMHLW